MVDIIIGCFLLLAALIILGYGFAFFYKDKDCDKLGFSSLATLVLCLFSLFFLKTCDNGMLVSWPDKYEGITRPIKYGDSSGQGIDLSKPARLPTTFPLEKK